MADVVIIHAADKRTAATRLGEAVAAAGYAITSVEVEEPERLAEALNGASADARILIWSRPLVSHALLSGDLPRIRQLRNVIEVSADGITPPSGGDDNRVVLISGWRGQPFHPGWQRIHLELKRLCGARKATVEAPRPAAAAAPAAGRPDAAASQAAAGQGTRRRTGLIVGGAAAALLAAAAVGSASWLGRDAPSEPPRQELPEARNPAPAAAAPLQQSSTAPASGAPAASAPGAAAESPPTVRTGGSDEAAAAAPAAKASSPRPSKTPDRAKPRPEPQGPAKKYSPKNSKVMRQFCERSGRSTPQCRTFLRSVRAAGE